MNFGGFGKPGGMGKGSGKPFFGKGFGKPWRFGKHFGKPFGKFGKWPWGI
jgi:hypothetical protein